MTWCGLEVWENIFFHLFFGGQGGEYCISFTGVLSTCCRFSKEKRKEEKSYKIHYVSRALELRVRKQFRTEAPENLWFKEK